MTRKVIPLRSLVNPRQVIERFRDLAADSERVAITRHALKRMRERDITRQQIIKAVQKGIVEEEPYRDTSQDWRASFRHIVCGDDVTVVAAIHEKEGGDTLVVITAF